MFTGIGLLFQRALEVGHGTVGHGTATLGLQSTLQEITWLFSAPFVEDVVSSNLCTAASGLSIKGYVGAPRGLFS